MECSPDGTDASRLYRDEQGVEPVDRFIERLPAKRAAKIDAYVAHIRERRFELDLTQQQVAERAQTSHSFISKLERGDHIPTIPVLKRILAVLDEELLIGVERSEPGGELEREIGPAPAPVT